MGSWALFIFGSIMNLGSTRISCVTIVPSAPSPPVRGEGTSPSFYGGRTTP